MVTALQPRTSFPISRIITDPLDTAIYYVRAVVRNAATNAVIDTVNLVDRGNRLFSTVWTTPADPSGQGLFITITTYVYTDSGYSSESPIYGESHDTFMVFNFLMPLNGGGGGGMGGGADINYDKIKKMIRVALEEATLNIVKAFPKLEIPEYPKTDLKPLTTTVGELGKLLAKELSDIKQLSIILGNKPEFTATDLAPVIVAIESSSRAVAEAIKSYIGNIDIPETDLKPVLDAINEKDTTSFDRLKKLLGEYQGVMQQLPNLLSGKGEEKKPESKSITRPQFMRPRI